MKITRRQLRQIIIEAVSGKNTGRAIGPSDVVSCYDRENNKMDQASKALSDIVRFKAALRSQDMMIEEELKPVKIDLSAINDSNKSERSKADKKVSKILQVMRQPENDYLPVLFAKSNLRHVMNYHPEVNSILISVPAGFYRYNGR